MKIRVLIFSLFLFVGLKFGVAAQQSQAKIYTPDEMEVLNEMHGEYTRVSTEILGAQKDPQVDDDDAPQSSGPLIGSNQLDSLDEEDEEDFDMVELIKEKVGDELKFFAKDSSLKRMIPWLAALCTLYFKGGLGQILNSVSWENLCEINKQNEKYFDVQKRSSTPINDYYDNREQANNEQNNLEIARRWRDPMKPIEDRIKVLNDALPKLEAAKNNAEIEWNVAWKEYSDNFLYSGWDKLGLGYAIAAYFCTEILISIITGLVSEKNTTSLLTLQRLEKSVRRMLSDEDKLDQDFREAVYDEFDTGFILLDKQVHPEFQESIIKALEKDYLLVHDRIKKQNATSSHVNVNFIMGALAVAASVWAITWDKDYTIKALCLGLIAFFVLNDCILPSKDNGEKDEILADIYQIIKSAKTRNFEYLRQKAQIKDMEIERNAAVKPAEDIVVAKPAEKIVETSSQAPATEAAVVQKSLLRRFFGFLTRRNTAVLDKKTETGEVKVDEKTADQVSTAEVVAKKSLLRRALGLLRSTLSLLTRRNAVTKKSEADEVKAEVEKVERELKLTEMSQQSQTNSKATQENSKNTELQKGSNRTVLKRIFIGTLGALIITIILADRAHRPWAYPF